MALACPNCRGAMEARSLASATKAVEIDVCFACHVFWFDAMESPALDGRSVLDLFGMIREHRDSQRQVIGANLSCPRCRVRLARTQDVQRTNRIEYHRCESCSGRLTTFFQFLREKNFVRSLSPTEMRELRVRVSQVRCSSCGAAVAVERDSACKHCGAAVSILDADAVDKAIHELRERSDRRPRAAQAARPVPAGGPAAGRSANFEWLSGNPLDAGSLFDIVTDAIEGFPGLFTD